jgi:3-phenylpropionate/trans-cinnamate dioxygenase ferredoxin component
MPEHFTRVADLDELPTGALRLVSVGDEEICLINAGGTIVALSNSCTHAGCDLSEEGELDGEEIECGCHGSRFSIATGEATAPPAREALRRFKVQIEGRDVLVSVPS